jgi:DNA-binding CsgD family transcriptional regulator
MLYELNQNDKNIVRRLIIHYFKACLLMKNDLKQNSELLHSVWDSTPERITSAKTHYVISEYNRLVTSLFCPGPHYYYIVDFYDRQIKQMSDSVKPILGFDPSATTFDDIINTIHPDDMSFVVKAEEAAYHFIYNIIGKENVMKYKVSYCFRSKVANGNYQLFNHQAIVLSVDESGGFGNSLNIHTNISHITEVNNRKVHLIRLADQTDVIEIRVDDSNVCSTIVKFFSKRETEIINLITLGFTNEQIAERLFISPHTVKNHRKNILVKASVKNSTELISRCLKEGLL